MDPVQADLRGKRALVTGANTGIGKEITRGLAGLGASVTMACRNMERAEAARQEILGEHPQADLEVLKVELGSQESIRSFLQAFKQKHDALHILVNNAGMWSRQRQESPDGIEMTWAVNQLGYFMVTTGLLDMLRNSAPARIINVASNLARGLDLQDPEFRRRRYDGVKAYAQSKQANRMFTWELAARLKDTGVTANAMHPGTVSTELFRTFNLPLQLLTKLYLTLFGRNPAQGADTGVWLGASPEAEGVSGQYFSDRQQRRCPYRDPQQMQQLWELCERMTEPKQQPTEQSESSAAHGPPAQPAS